MYHNTKLVIAFDLYGTLLSTESIATELASHFGISKAQSISSLWRRYQLEYTWRMNSMSLYKPFSEITHAALLHALAESHVSPLSDAQISSLMEAYNSLATFPDVAVALTSLAQTPEIEPYIFSNGSDEMVTSSVRESPGLRAYQDVFKGIITVEEVRKFKPDRQVYDSLVRKVGKKDDVADIWLVSSNPFDVVGSKAAGIKAAWVDRAGGGWTDRLGDLAEGGPTIIVKGVDEAVEAIKGWIPRGVASKQ